MITLTPCQMKKIDEYTINEIGIPGSVLMENAALAVVNEIVKDFASIKGKDICVVAGRGNNGGDAFAIARHLFNKGAVVTNILLAEKGAVLGDACVNLEILDKMKVNTIEVKDISNLKELKAILEKAEVIVDGIFGTGLRRDIDGLDKELVNLINSMKKPVIAIDIPSGVNGETGEIAGVCIKAYKTVTFAFPKVGHFIHPGCDYTGELVIADISIPQNTLNNIEIDHFAIDEEYVAKLIPKRRPDSNKGSFGKILVVTGSVGMTGAGCLAGGAALRTGAGLVYLAVPASLISIYETNLLEAVKIPLDDIGGIISGNSEAELKKQFENMDVIAVGPGLSTGGGVGQVVAGIVKGSTKPLVIDADAINALVKDVSVLKRKSVPLVITPHPGEMARLMGTSVEEIQKNRIKTARDFSKNFEVITVLKGSRTIVASPDGRVYINTTGNSGMATGGTGDVLTGVIASFIGQGLEPLEAAVAGVYIHGLSGDIATASTGEHGLTAGDLVEKLPLAIKKLAKA